MNSINIFKKFSQYLYLFLILLTLGCVNTKLDNGVIELGDSNTAEAYKLKPLDPLAYDLTELLSNREFLKLLLMNKDL